MVARRAHLEELGERSVRFPAPVSERGLRPDRATPGLVSPRSGSTTTTFHPRAEQVTARLIVRRVRQLNPDSVPASEGELFPGYRHRAESTGRRGRPPGPPGPTDRLALARRLHPAVHHRLRTTLPGHNLTTPAAQPRTGRSHRARHRSHP